MLTNKKALIFDLDGTLADTLGAITEAINMTMDAYGFARKSDEQVKNAIGSGAKMLIKRLVLSDYPQYEGKIDEILSCYDDMYAKTYLGTREMYDGMKETVETLAEKGYLIAVLSNKPDPFTKGLVAQLFPHGEVAVTRGQTDLPIKPDPAGVRVVLDELGVTPDRCVFIGDSGVDYRTAVNSGMDFIGAGWGFWGRERLAEQGAEIIADEPREILTILNA